jgi:hypothetical protein
VDQAVAKGEATLGGVRDIVLPSARRRMKLVVAITLLTDARSNQWLRVSGSSTGTFCARPVRRMARAPAAVMMPRAAAGMRPAATAAAAGAKARSTI